MQRSLSAVAVAATIQRVGKSHDDSAESGAGPPAEVPKQGGVGRRLKAVGLAAYARSAREVTRAWVSNPSGAILGARGSRR